MLIDLNEKYITVFVAKFVVCYCIFINIFVLRNITALIELDI